MGAPADKWNLGPRSKEGLVRQGEAGGYSNQRREHLSGSLKPQIKGPKSNLEEEFQVCGLESKGWTLERFRSWHLYSATNARFSCRDVGERARD